MHTIPRRHALRQLGLIAAGLAAACTPMRVLVSAYPQGFDDDDGLVDRVLRAFVTAVIPGAPADDPNLVRAHTDPAYPFAQYAGFFAADLSRRAARRVDGRAFERLDVRGRRGVSAEGLGADGARRERDYGRRRLAPD